MKKILLPVLLLAGIHTLQAQSPATLPSLQQHRQHLGTWLQKGHTAHTRSGTQRVIGQSTRNYTGSFTDSSKITYHPAGSSVYDYNTMLYAYNYPYNTTPLFNNYQGIYTQPQVQYKRHDRWTINPNTLLYGFYQRDLAAYDAYQNLVTDTVLYADSNTYSNMIYVNTFNPDDQIEKGYWLNWNDGVADSAFKQYFQYDGGGALVKDSLYEWGMGSWHLVAKTLYTHDGSGNVTLVDHYSNQSDPTFTNPLIQQLQYISTYDGSNRLLTLSTNYYDGTSLAPYVRDTFAYTGALDFHTAWREHQYDPINFTWTPQLNMIKHLDANDQPDTVNIYSYDQMIFQWVPFSRYVMTYNSELNPLTRKEYIYDFTAFPAIPDFSTTYYYEDGLIVTSVSAQAVIPASARVYPNPTTGTVTIELADKNALYTSVRLLDLQGKTIHTIPLSAQDVLKIDLSSLEKGIYVLTLKSNSGTENFRLVKE